MKITKKIATIFLGIALFASAIFGAAGFAFGKKVYAESDLRSLYLQYLQQNGVTEQTVTPEQQAEFIKNYADSFKGYYGKKGNASDFVTEDGVNFVNSVFGRNKEDFLVNGGTIGTINYEGVTGRFKKSSFRGVEAGGATIEDGDFSVIVMGDQQTAVEYHSEFVAESYDYITANAAAMNLKMFINVGDIVDDVDFLSWRQPSGNPRTEVNFHPGKMTSYEMQLEFAKNQMLKLVNNGIPSAFVYGNHDYADMAESYRIKDDINRYFDISNYEGKSYFGETLYNDLEAATYYFEANGTEYMTITLGCYPTDDILAWANEKVSANADKKVIVATHAYIDGLTRDLTDEGRKIWNDFAKKHENIVMVVSGHECTEDSTVIKKVDFGDNGNAVTQFMINAQIEEFGGSGLFAQLIFRKSGEIDFVYYSPYVANHYGKGYFMDENQFSFDLNPKLAGTNSAGEKVYGKTLSAAEGKISYTGDENTSAYLKNVYAANNVQVTRRGLTATGSDGYIVYEADCGEDFSFNKFAVATDGFLEKGGAIVVYVSEDAKTWKEVLYLNSSSDFGDTYSLDRFVFAKTKFYLKLAVNGGATLSSFTYSSDKVRTVFADTSNTVNLDFTRNAPESSFKEYSKEGIVDSFRAVLAGGKLGSGGNGRLTYSSYVTTQYRACEGRTLTGVSLDFTLAFVNPYIGAAEREGFEFCEETPKILYRVLVSSDGGKTWKQAERYTYADFIADENTSSYHAAFNAGEICELWKQTDITPYIEGNDVLVKLVYSGAGKTYSDVGIKQLNATVTYDKAESNNSSEYDLHLNGGVMKEGVPQREGYEFIGWCTDEALTDLVNLDNYSGDKTEFWAKYKRTAFNITFVTEDGVTHDNPSVVGAGETITLKPAEKEGGRFIGWYDENGVKYTSVEGSSETDVVLYAVFGSGANGGSGCSSGVAFGSFGSLLLAGIAAAMIVINKKTHKNI